MRILSRRQTMTIQFKSPYESVFKQKLTINGGFFSKPCLIMGGLYLMYVVFWEENEINVAIVVVCVVIQAN